MMAVETNKGDVSPAQTLTGVAAAVNGKHRRKRPSSLLQAASSLPTVESSLDEFISRANQTLTDPDQWHAAEEAAKQQDSDQREQDQLRWRAAEQQLREGDVREQSLRRQLDGLQGRLAEAEARAAVAGTGSHDGVIADLKMRLTRSDERIAAAEYHAQQAEGRTQQLATELTAVKATAVSTPSTQFFNAGDADDRIRIAEAKASKAIAIARAASAGLTVSPGDIAAIESGLVVPDHGPAKGTNWIAIAGAFIGGLAIMFGVSRMTAKDQPAAPVAAAAAVAPAPAVPVKPTVTPIEEPKDTAAAAAPAADPNKAAEAAAPVPTTDPAKPEPPKTDMPVAAEPAKITQPAKHGAPAAVAPKHTTPAAKKQQPAAAGSIADPFGDSTTAKKTPGKKTPEKKPAGGAIVDPF
ncbi:MAG: hypothetical protein ABI591_08125 [Kofleriaceae bacterium]